MGLPSPRFDSCRLCDLSNLALSNIGSMTMGLLTTMSSIKGRFGNDDNCLRGEPGVQADALLDFSLTKGVERPILILYPMQ